MAEMTEIQLALVASLLHDIGKFWQRACQPGERPADQKLWEWVENYLPRAPGTGRPTHLHAAWGACFVYSVFPEGQEREQIAKIVAAHHNVETQDSDLRRATLALQLGDWLSSGERREDEGEETSEPHIAPLRSLFGEIRIPPRHTTNGLADLVPEQLDFLLAKHTRFDEGMFFPVRSSEGANTKEDYAQLWEKFEKDAQALDRGLLNADSLFFLLSQYTVRIPAATPWRQVRSVPDISLFDHSRITAAATTCLLAQGLSVSDLEILRSKCPTDGDWSRERLFRLIGGDMSGIQKFIYSISGENAARTLKGRSFFIQLLCEAIANYIWQKLDLNRSCQIYNSGGRFYLLAPSNGPSIENLQEEINDKLAQFHGDLLLVLGEASLCPNDFKGAIATKWEEVNRIANSKKRKKFSSYARRAYSEIFGHLDNGGTVRQCRVCHAELEQASSSGSYTAGPSQSRHAEASADDEYIERTECPLCESFAELGRDLRRGVLLLYLRPDGKAEKGYNSILGEFGLRVLVTQDVDSRKLETDALRAVFQINEYDPSKMVGQLDAAACSESVAICYRFLGSHFPVKSENDQRKRLKTFEELAGESVGDKKLGILRADVDDLGMLFARGLGNLATLSRVATLSRLLTDFFEGYISYLLQKEQYSVARTPEGIAQEPLTIMEQKPFKPQEFEKATALIYSGGDDLFLVGAWDAVVEAAAAIRRAFRRYVGDSHPDFTLSCGIAVVHPKYPILAAANLAGEAEEASKRFRTDGGKGPRPKNALTLFDTTISWDKEYERFEYLKNLIVFLLTNGHDGKPLPHAFLHKLYAARGAYEKEKKLAEDEMKARILGSRATAATVLQYAGVKDWRSYIEQIVRWSRWRWLLVYSLRQYRRGKQPDLVEEVQKMILDEKLEARIGLSLRWAEKILRGG